MTKGKIIEDINNLKVPAQVQEMKDGEIYLSDLIDKKEVIKIIDQMDNKDGFYLTKQAYENLLKDKLNTTKQEPKGTGWKMHKLMQKFIDSAEGSDDRDKTNVTLLIRSEDMIDVLNNIVQLAKSGDNAEILHTICGYCIGYKQSLINQKNMWSRSQGGL